MSESKGIVLAAKSSPQENILDDIKEAGLGAVELYISSKMLEDVCAVSQVCKKFPFRYAVHAPNEGCNPHQLAELVNAISSEVVVFHDIYWEDEWRDIVNIFKNSEAKLCVENTFNVHEPLKFMRRYGFGRCLDLEHLQMECSGVYEEEFLKVMKQASHIHLTGYIYPSELWHTHIHHSPKHGLYLLGLLKKSGYSGFVVSEAKIVFQILSEFKALNKFYQEWRGVN